LTRRLIMDLVCIVIFETEYNIAFSGNPLLTRRGDVKPLV
jgi:hypothetical protein